MMPKLWRHPVPAATLEGVALPSSMATCEFRSTQEHSRLMRSQCASARSYS